jgi:NDP-sugar pyrophosphorylase family protein
MKALILANGEGERLRPLTEKMQKAMVPINGKPAMQIIIEHLKQSGVTDFILAVGIKKEQVIDYFKDGKDFGVKIEYSINQVPQGTAGELSAAKKFLNNEEDFLVYYGDSLTNINFNDFYKFHKSNSGIITSPVMKEIYVESGIYLCENNTALSFTEKPFLNDLVKLEGVFSNVPIFLMSNKVWQSPGIMYGNDINIHVVPEIVKSGEFKIFFQPGLWHLDIGNLKKYKAACLAYEKNEQSKLRKLA